MRTTIFGLLILFLPASLTAETDSRLKRFDYLTLGMSYESLRGTGDRCDVPKDIPGFRGSSKLGVTSTVCPAAETFALATLYQEKLAAVAVNWVSWAAKDSKKSDSALAEIPETLRRSFGIPAATIAYESQFGNADADRYCLEKGGCRIHFWQSQKPDRVASLVYAVVENVEVPLIFHLADLEAEGAIRKLKDAASLVPNR